MSGLSSRVMNMKFMNSSDKSSKQKGQQDQLKKVKDGSEWILPNASKIKSRANGNYINSLDSIGYSGINSFEDRQDFGDEENDNDDNDEDEIIPTPANVGRKVWGAPIEPKQEEELTSELSDISSLKNSNSNSKVCTHIIKEVS